MLLRMYRNMIEWIRILVALISTVSLPGVTGYSLIAVRYSVSYVYDYSNPSFDVMDLMSAQNKEAVITASYSRQEAVITASYNCLIRDFVSSRKALSPSHTLPFNDITVSTVKQFLGAVGSKLAANLNMTKVYDSGSGNLMVGEERSGEISTWSTTKAPEITETGGTTGTELLLTEDWSVTDEEEASENKRSDRFTTPYPTTVGEVTEPLETEPLILSTEQGTTTEKGDESTTTGYWTYEVTREVTDEATEVARETTRPVTEEPVTERVTTEGLMTERETTEEAASERETTERVRTEEAATERETTRPFSDGTEQKTEEDGVMTDGPTGGVETTTLVYYTTYPVTEEGTDSIETEEETDGTNPVTEPTKPVTEPTEPVTEEATKPVTEPTEPATGPVTEEATEYETDEATEEYTVWTEPTRPQTEMTQERTEMTQERTEMTQERTEESGERTDKTEEARTRTEEWVTGATEEWVTGATEEWVTGATEEWVTGVTEEWVTDLTEPTEERTEPTEERTEATEERTEATEERTEATEERTEATEERTEATEERTEATEERTEATEERTEATEERTEATEERTEATEERTEATEERTEATEERTEATEERTEATEERTEATEERTEATEERTEATEERTEATEERTEATEERTEATEERTEATEERTEATEERTEATEERTEATEERTEATEERTEATEERTEATEERTEATEERTEATEERTEATEERTEATEERTEATEERTEATEERTEATEERTEATEERTEATEERTEATEERTEATEERTEATEERTEATEERTEATEERTEATEERTEATEERTDATEGVTEVTEERTEATEERTDVTEGVTGVTETVTKEWSDFWRTEEEWTEEWITEDERTEESTEDSLTGQTEPITFRTVISEDSTDGSDATKTEELVTGALTTEPATATQSVALSQCEHESFAASQEGRQGPSCQPDGRYYPQQCENTRIVDDGLLRKTLKSGCLSLLTIRSFGARDGLGLSVRVWLGFGLGGYLCRYSLFLSQSPSFFLNLLLYFSSYVVKKLFVTGEVTETAALTTSAPVGDNCWQALRNSISQLAYNKDQFLPACQENGNFQRGQCQGTMCWCVEEVTGAMIEGTSKPGVIDCQLYIEGVCPKFVRSFNTPFRCSNKCNSDSMCYGSSKCCDTPCGRDCVLPQLPATTKEGLCPALTSTNYLFQEEDQCQLKCVNDGACSGQEKCCFNGCGYECKQPSFDTQVYCSPVEPIYRGSIQAPRTDGLVEGDVVSISCDEGFELQGSSEIRCTAEGEWDVEPPICKRRECPEIESLDYGRVFIGSSGRSYGNRIAFICDPGYYLTGSEVRSCLADGNWSGTDAICTRGVVSRRECPEIESLDYGRVFIGSSGRSYGNRIAFICDPGYYLTGSEVRSCLADGNWYPALGWYCDAMCEGGNRGGFCGGVLSHHLQIHPVPLWNLYNITGGHVVSNSNRQPIKTRHLGHVTAYHPIRDTPVSTMPDRFHRPAQRVGEWVSMPVA
eukprot:sb/3460860/